MFGRPHAPIAKLLYLSMVGGFIGGSGSEPLEAHFGARHHLSVAAKPREMLFVSFSKRFQQQLKVQAIRV